MSFGNAPSVGVPHSVVYPPFSSPAMGKLKPGTAPAPSTATDVATLVTDHNNLLAALKAAGFLK